MPERPKTLCAEPGCNVLVDKGRCELHARQVERPGSFKAIRKSRHERGYGYEWSKRRKVVLQRDGYLCQRCKRAGRITAANIVDHIIPKAEGGTDDYDNLQVICNKCHQLKTAEEAARGGQTATMEPEWLPRPTVPVVVVCGPPASGKTLYVREQAGPNDLVLDLDAIASQLFGVGPYQADKAQYKAAIRYRNKMLAALGDKDCGYPKAWLIVTAGAPAKRAFWQKKYGTPVIMRTPKEECMQRVRGDDRRSPDQKRRAIEAILAWA